MYIIDSMSMYGSLQSLDEIHPIQILTWTPTSVEPGATFDIYYTLQNTSVSTAWQVFGYLLDGSGTLIAGSEWDSGITLGAGQSMESPHYSHAGITSSINVTVVVGHIGLDVFTFSAMENPAAGGTITGTADGAYAQNTPISIIAYSSSGYTFVNWTGTGITGLPSTNPALSFNMPANTVSVQANFQMLPTDCTNPSGATGDRRCIDGYWANCNGGQWVYETPPSECPVECDEAERACIDGYISICDHGAWSPTTAPCVPSTPTNWLLIGALVAASIIGSAFIIGRK